MELPSRRDGENIPATAIIEFGPVLFPGGGHWFWWTSWNSGGWCCFAGVFPTAKDEEEEISSRSLRGMRRLTRRICSNDWRLVHLDHVSRNLSRRRRTSVRGGGVQSASFYLVSDCYDPKRRSDGLVVWLWRLSIVRWSTNKHWRILKEITPK